MFIPYRSALALGLSAFVLAGCGDSSDSEATAGPDSDGGSTTEVPKDPDPIIVPPPVAELAPDFIVRPYLQAPGTDTMTVMFETENTEPEVWARVFGSGQEFHKVSGEVHSEDGLVYRAPLTALDSNTLYEYYVLTNDAEGVQRVTQPFAFKTWPNANDGVTEAKFIALSDTQLDKSIYEVVLHNVVTDGFMAHECDGSKPETCAENIAGITISGDVVQTGGNRGNWRNQLFGRMADITPYVPLITVPGNHDYYYNAELELYRTYMSPPENGSVDYEDHWYFLDYLDLRLVGLDSYPISGAHGKFNQDTLAVQRQWLKETLNDAELQQKQFVMGMFHHGCLSEMWNAGESIGSCEMVTELERYSERTNAITGHFFGHTHTYSRGQSLNTSHLWLNAASASGYIEPLDNANFQNTQISDYDTFEVSRSEFGYSVLTYTFGPDAAVTLERKKGGYDGDVDFEIVDTVTFEAELNSNLPQVTAGSGDLAMTDVELAIQVGAPEQVHEVQWQISETEAFDDVVFDVWGNETRRRNIFYDEASQVGGDLYMGYEPIDTQQGADIFRLDLSGFLAGQSVRPGADDYYRWNKRYSSQNTHSSVYDDYAGKTRPELDLKPGTSYYWRARVRDDKMNWSAWSATANFAIEGTRTENLLVNGGGESGDLTGWTVSAGRVSVISGASNGGFAASEGDYYFTGRGFGNGQPEDCCTDTAYQLVDLSSYADNIDAGAVYLEASAELTTWNGVDEPEFVIELLNASGQPVAWEGSATLTTKTAKNWENVGVTGAVPAGVRTAKVYIGGTRKQGNDNDVYFDDVSVNLLY